ncbi:MAG: hypothetical protein ACP5Q3_13375 [bacterium]
MYKKLVMFMSLLFLLASCAALDPIEVKEQKYGKSIPIISESFASKQIKSGDTWKVYLKAHDPDGDMKNIVCVIDQAGKGVYPVSRIRIREEDRKEFSGYIYLYTAGIQGLNYVPLTLTVQIEDKAGHFTQPVSFPLFINNASIQERPPSGVFQEKELGPILINLRPLGEDGDKQDFDK